VDSLSFDPKSLSFVQCLQRLEQLGYLEKTRIGSTPRLGFPVSSNQALFALSDEQWYLAVNFSGLYGVDSVLPGFMNEAALSSEPSSESFQAFLNLFEHPLHLWRYRIWKKSFFPLGLQCPRHPYQQALAALAGHRWPASQTETEGCRDPSAPLAAYLSGPVFNQESLRKVASFVLNAQVLIRSRVPIWRIFRGARSKILGKTLLGKRYLDTRQALEILVTVETNAQMRDLYYGKSGVRRLREILKGCLPPSLEIIIRLRQRLSGPNLAKLNGPYGLGLGLSLGLVNTSRDHECLLMSHFCSN